MKQKVKKIIFSSTGGAIYGERNNIQRQKTLSHLTALSPYGIHKLTFEKYLHYYCQVYGQPYTILRLANVYGPRQYKGGESGVVSIFVDNAVNERESMTAMAPKPETLSMSGISLSALSRAMETDYVGAINIGTGIEKSVSDVVLAIELALGKSIKKKNGPAKAGEQERSCLAIQKAKEILGWEPQVLLDEGIRKTIA